MPLACERLAVAEEASQPAMEGFNLAGAGKEGGPWRLFEFDECGYAFLGT